MFTLKYTKLIITGIKLEEFRVSRVSFGDHFCNFAKQSRNQKLGTFKVTKAFQPDTFSSLAQSGNKLFSRYPLYKYATRLNELFKVFTVSWSSPRRCTK